MIYDKLANYYDQFVDEELNAIYINMIKKHKTEGSVLDIGTGTAQLAIQLAKENFFVTGCDISQKMLERAYNNAVMNGVHIQLYTHNVLEPINQSFDVFTMCSDVINYLQTEDEIEKAFANIRAVMNNDSIFLFDFLTPSFMDKMNNYKEDILLEDDVMQWSVTKTNVENQIKHSLRFGHLVETHFQRTFTLKKYKELLDNTGFTVLKKKKTDERIILLCTVK